MALSKIGTANGIEAERQRLLKLDPGAKAHNIVFGKPGTTYPESTAPVEGTMNKLVEGHNAFMDLTTELKRRPF